MCDTRRCILLDLSQSGAQIGLEKPLREGESAILELEGIDQFGTIIWQSEGRHGGANGFQFDNRLNKADVLAVRQYAESFEIEQMRALKSEARAWVSGIK